MSRAVPNARTLHGGFRDRSPASKGFRNAPGWRSFGLGLLLWIGALAVSADDWPQWRGPRRDGVSAEKGWLDHWPVQQTPRVAWRAQVGTGHSTVVVRNGLAFGMGWDGQQDTLFCLDARTGKERWRKSYPCAGIQQWPGPRATPTVSDDTVFTLGQHGQLRAYAVADGAERWQRQLADSYKPDVDYGFAWSPLLVGDHLLLSAGSRGLAIRAHDGSIAWGDDGKPGACVSPVPYQWQGKHGVVVVVTNEGRETVSLVGIDPQSGTEFWRWSHWAEKWGAACVDPLVHEGKLFFTTSEQYQRCARFSIIGNTLREDWAHPRLAVYTGACVLLDQHLYAINRRGLLKCLDWRTGAEQWYQRGFGEFASLIAADGRLIVQTSDSGEVVVVKADPRKYREERRAKVFQGEAATFTAPVLANGRLYCRGYAGEIVCLDLSASQP